jgi:hypothetical protein
VALAKMVNQERDFVGRIGRPFRRE